MRFLYALLTVILSSLLGALPVEAQINIDRLTGVQSAVALKAPVRVATTTNITLYGYQTIDGVAVTDNFNTTQMPDRVLVKDQTNPVENGIYFVNSSTWTRAPDMSNSRAAVFGTLVNVTSGATYTDATFKLATTESPIVFNSSTITFTRYQLPVSYTIITSGSTDITSAPYNAKCDGVTDDSAAFTLAFASSVSLSLAQPPRACKINTPLTMDINRIVSYNGNGGWWDMSAITSATTTSATALQIINTASSNGAIPYEYRPVINNLRVLGQPSVASASIAGIGGISETTHNFSTDRLVVDGFTYGHGVSTNAYLIAHHNGAINHTVNPVIESGCSNCGENMSYEGYRFTNNNGPIIHNNANGDMKIAHSSFDINTLGATWISLTTGNISSFQNHYENLTGNNATSPLISIGDADAAYFSSFGDRLLFSSGSPPFTGTSSTIFVGARGSAYFCALDYNSTSMLGGSFISGTGKVTFCPGSTHFGAVSNNNVNIATISNTFVMLLSDGDMESSTAPIPPKDLWTITRDTPAYGVVSRTAGVNISLTTVNGSAHTGSQYLAMNKATIATSNAQWRLIAPIPRYASVAGSLWYQKPTTQTGAWFISFKWGRCNGQDINGIPQTLAEQTIGTTTVNSTSSAIPWTQVNINMFSNVHAPAWADCFIEDFNGDSLGIGEIDIDTNILNAN